MQLVGCLYYCVSDARSYKHQRFLVILLHLAEGKIDVVSGRKVLHCAPFTQLMSYSRDVLLGSPFILFYDIQRFKAFLYFFEVEIYVIFNTEIKKEKWVLLAFRSLRDLKTPGVSSQPG